MNPMIASIQELPHTGSNSPTDIAILMLVIGVTLLALTRFGK